MNIAISTDSTINFYCKRAYELYFNIHIIITYNIIKIFFVDDEKAIVMYKILLLNYLEEFTEMIMIFEF